MERWEQVTGLSLTDLSADYLSFRVAQYELEAETGDWPGPAYRRDPQWQLDFWKEQFALNKGTPAARICVREINRLRGR